ncbi:MAG: sigma-54 dependent transcriptional regulator [Terriglobia bacterium]
MNQASFRAVCRVPSSAIVASANKDLRNRILGRLRAQRWTVEEAMGGAEALSLVEDGVFGALLLDRWLPDLEVSELVQIVKSRHPQVQVMLLGSEAEERLLLERLSRPEGLPLGFPEAHEVEEKPGPGFSTPSPIEEGNQECGDAGPLGLQAPDEAEEPLPGMIGLSATMQRVYHLARLIIPRDTTALITGDTGTGKELMARAIHRLGPRARQPFVIVNCAAIPESLMESELFGYSRGAFTGAFQSRLGRIHAAHGGTLFLDEVGNLPPGMQGKLLRFLQEGEVQRLGSPDVFRVDVRVIAATNLDLGRALADGRFNDALYYRLCVFPIKLPALRERRDDILPLATHFLASFCRDASLPSKSISLEVGKRLEAHAWPGNVRQLKHVIERAFILSQSALVLRPEHIDLLS